MLTTRKRLNVATNVIWLPRFLRGGVDDLILAFAGVVLLGLGFQLEMEAEAARLF